ncbi:leucyl/phenylalanyl-tRNA--protein transferase [Phenylobacterium sp.]|jgi:leucyl/phenylalanyl-tRNA--protein transferase|uniref:leucyl/phenylalanyl-tRNA--protein transferase n=1 Tax=Phenylobacterium sp. TaxID=1871053 RepID=UPI0039C9CE04
MKSFGVRDLLLCYARGVFPMADSRDDEQIFLIDPERRGVLPLDRFHVSRRLARTVRGDHYEVRTDTAFDAVVAACAQPRPGHPDTWINDTIRRLYGQLHQLGHAHSVECWKDGALVGGLYGVSLKAAFFGESMFSLARDASKVALVHLAARLIAGGYRLLDTQFLTEHLTQFGVTEISRRDYRRRLARALAADADFQVLGAGGGSERIGGGAGAGSAAGAAGLGFAAGRGADAGISAGARALQVITQAS